MSQFRTFFDGFFNRGATVLTIIDKNARIHWNIKSAHSGLGTSVSCRNKYGLSVYRSG